VKLYQILTRTATVLMHSRVCTLLLFISVEQECVQWTEPRCACAWAVTSQWTVPLEWNTGMA